MIITKKECKNPLQTKGKRYAYYEDGYRQIFSMRDIYRMFVTKVDDEQKAEGTNFYSWLDEMEKMQILNKI